MEVDVGPVVESDIIDLAQNARDADIEEIKASSGLDIESSIRASLRTSEYSMAARFDGRLAAIFGSARRSALSDIGVVWCIGTDMVDRFPLGFVRHSRIYIDAMRNVYAKLENHVDARNTRSIRWLRAMGFTLSEPAPYGLAGLPFHYFCMEGRNV